MWNCSTSNSQTIVFFFFEKFPNYSWNLRRIFLLYNLFLFVLFQSLYVSNYWGVTGPCFWNKTTCFDSQVELFYMHSTSSFLIVHIFLAAHIYCYDVIKKLYWHCVIWGVEATKKSKSLVVWVKDLIASTKVQVGE